jgi:hypothetical protein
MADEEKSADNASTPAATAEEVLSTQIVGSVESYQRLGEVFVSALAALPGITLLTSLVRAPGDAGLDHDFVIAGVGCAAAAVAVGIGLAVWIRAPVELDRNAISNLDWKLVLGTNQLSYDRLLDRIDQLGDQIVRTTNQKEREVYARRRNAVLATLRRVHLLATAKAMRARVLSAETIVMATAALGLAAAAVTLLALAPNPKTEAPGGPTVVDIKLTPTGQSKLGCPTDSFAALKVGGTDTEPQVIPIGGITCEAGGFLQIKVAEQQGLATKISAAKPATETSP